MYSNKRKHIYIINSICTLIMSDTKRRYSIYRRFFFFLLLFWAFFLCIPFTNSTTNQIQYLYDALKAYSQKQRSTMYLCVCVCGAERGKVLFSFLIVFFSTFILDSLLWVVVTWFLAVSGCYFFRGFFFIFLDLLFLDGALAFSLTWQKKHEADINFN